MIFDIGNKIRSIVTSKNYTLEKSNGFNEPDGVNVFNHFCKKEKDGYITSILDTIEDTQYAINHYKGKMNKSFGYQVYDSLYIYGVLSAVGLQQDCIHLLIKLLEIKGLLKKEDYDWLKNEQINNIRKIRHQIVHSTNKEEKKDKKSCITRELKALSLARTGTLKQFKIQDFLRIDKFHKEVNLNKFLLENEKKIEKILQNILDKFKIKALEF